MVRIFDTLVRVVGMEAIEAMVFKVVTVFMSEKDQLGVDNEDDDIEEDHDPMDMDRHLDQDPGADFKALVSSPGWYHGRGGRQKPLERSILVVAVRAFINYNASTGIPEALAIPENVANPEK